MDIETIKRLHTVHEDMILGNIEYAHKQLGKILTEQYLILKKQEDICTPFHSTDFTGKCFNCKKQIFIK
jgi:hypothetical protein